MNKIKFSHKYYKFPSAYQKSQLTQVIVIEESEISQTFRMYDTSFRDGIGKEGMYPLPRGKLILIILVANEGKGWLWTTIRRWTPEKDRYYRGLVGHVVECEVTET